MKLYDLERGSKLLLHLKSPDDTLGTYQMCTLNNLDGMYSNITIDAAPDEGPVHLAAVTPMKKVGDHYEIDEEQD